MANELIHPAWESAFELSQPTQELLGGGPPRFYPENPGPQN